MTMTRRPPTKRLKVDATTYRKLSPSPLFWLQSVNVPGPNQLDFQLQELYMPPGVDPVENNPVTEPNVLVRPNCGFVEQGATIYVATQVDLDAVGTFTFTFDVAYVPAAGDRFTTGAGLQEIFTQTADERIIPLQDYTL